MNIAILFGEIGYISRTKIIDGIRDHAQKNKDNVFLYTCEGFMYHELEDYISGEYNIYNLPNFDLFDGVIIDVNSIQNEAVTDMLVEKISEANIPCVSFDKVLENTSVINFDNIFGFKKLVDYLIEDKGVTDFVYLSGNDGNRDSMQRKNVFIEETSKHGIKLSKNAIRHGDFTYECGRELVREMFANNEKLPRAFVAANDYMAIGIMSELKKFGIRIPDDVYVTGYDNCDLVEYTNPRLSTVDRCEFEAGQIAYDMLLKRITGEVTGNAYYNHPGKPVISKSVGADVTENHSEDSDLCVNMIINMDSSLDLIKGLSISLSNVEDIKDFDRAVEKYINSIGVEFFYFCQSGSRELYYNELDLLALGKDLPRDQSQYTETVWCPLAYEMGEWTSYPAFDTKHLLPPSSLFKRENSYYIVMPVHQGRTCIGYIVLGNFKKSLSGRVLQHLIINIDEVIGNVFKQDISRTMLAKINQRWQYDALTGLYNRSGMHVKIKDLIVRAKCEDNGIGVVFFDLDGLKKINDTLGHEAGDQYIKAMGKMLFRQKKEDEIVVRYGGDEFIVISKQESEESTKERYEELLNSLYDPVTASAGYSFASVNSEVDLKQIIEVADRNMYENKRKRKKNRAK